MSSGGQTSKRKFKLIITDNNSSNSMCSSSSMVAASTCTSLHYHRSWEASEGPLCCLPRSPLTGLRGIWWGGAPAWCNSLWCALLSTLSNPSQFSPPSIGQANLLAGFRRRSFHPHAASLINTGGKGLFSRYGSAHPHTVTVDLKLVVSQLLDIHLCTLFMLLREAHWPSFTVCVTGSAVQQLSVVYFMCHCLCLCVCDEQSLI